MTRDYARMISILEVELSVLDAQIESGMGTSQDLGRHMLIREQIRELKHLHNRLEYDTFESYEYDE